MKPTMSFQDWCTQNHAYLILHFYHEGKNPIPPDEIGFSSRNHARFRCHVCGLSWRRTLNNITNHPINQTCPYCERRKPSPFYNLATEYPELKEEWDNEKNLFPPETCLPHSKRSVYWHCAKNHYWKDVIGDRAKTADKARRSGFPVCPYCSGARISATYNLATEYPEVSREWNYIKNKGQKPEDFPPHSNQKVWWICGYDSSHQWQARISNRTSLSRGCPQCTKEFKMSYPARALFYYLRKTYPNCVCEKTFQKYKMDIFLPDINLVLEHDGYYRHSSDADKKRAERKDYALCKAGYQVLRICDCKDLADPVVSQDTKILYRYDERNQYLDQMIAETFRYLGSPPLDFNHRRDQYEINQMYFHERKKRTLAVEYPEIAMEWSSKNLNKPDTILSGSPRKVWWHCPKCQQEYQATVANRTKNHSKCPFCANLRAYEKNCLATLRPEIAAQWHPELNLPLTPYDVVPVRKKKYTGNVQMVTPGNHPSLPAPVPAKADVPSVILESYSDGPLHNLWILLLLSFGIPQKICRWFQIVLPASQIKNSGGNAKEGTNGKVLPAIFIGFPPQRGVPFVIIVPSAQIILCLPEIQNWHRNGIAHSISR